MKIVEDNIEEFKTDFPKSWSFLWSPEEAEIISEEHKDQIHFLNNKGTELVTEFLKSSKLLANQTKQNLSPFREDYFKTQENFNINLNQSSEIKKWLFYRGIPFDKYVFIDSERSGLAVMLTWKMIIKYWEGLFFVDDLTIFDGSLNWALHYSEEGQLFYGKDNVFNIEAEFEKNLEQNRLLNEIKNRNK